MNRKNKSLKIHLPAFKDFILFLIFCFLLSFRRFILLFNLKLNRYFNDVAQALRAVFTVTNVILS